jgi:hypothetical protein
MAGIFDEVMDGIAAKEKQTPPAAPPAPPAGTEPPPAGGQPPPPKTEEKGLHEYAEAFKAKYGERKKSS